MNSYLYKRVATIGDGTIPLPEIVAPLQEFYERHVSSATANAEYLRFFKDSISPFLGSAPVGGVEASRRIQSDKAIKEGLRKGLSLFKDAAYTNLYASLRKSGGWDKKPANFVTELKLKLDALSPGGRKVAMRLTVEFFTASSTADLVRSHFESLLPHIADIKRKKSEVDALMFIFRDIALPILAWGLCNHPTEFSATDFIEGVVDTVSYSVIEAYGRKMNRQHRSTSHLDSGEGSPKIRRSHSISRLSAISPPPEEARRMLLGAVSDVDTDGEQPKDIDHLVVAAAATRKRNEVASKKAQEPRGWTFGLDGALSLLWAGGVRRFLQMPQAPGRILGILGYRVVALATHEDVEGALVTCHQRETTEKSGKPGFFSQQVATVAKHPNLFSSPPPLKAAGSSLLVDAIGREALPGIGESIDKYINAAYASVEQGGEYDPHEFLGFPLMQVFADVMGIAVTPEEFRHISTCFGDAIESTSYSAFWEPLAKYVKHYTGIKDKDAGAKQLLAIYREKMESDEFDTRASALSPRLLQLHYRYNLSKRVQELWKKYRVEGCSKQEAFFREVRQDPYLSEGVMTDEGDFFINWLLDCEGDPGFELELDQKMKSLRRDSNMLTVGLRDRVDRNRTDVAWPSRNKNALTDDEVAYSLGPIAIGVLTTAQTLPHLLKNLAANPRVFKGVKTEVDSMNDTTINDILSGKTSEQVLWQKYPNLMGIIGETFRLTPAAGAMIRATRAPEGSSSKSEARIGGFRFSDTNFLLSLWGANRDPKVFGETEATKAAKKEILADEEMGSITAEEAAARRADIARQESEYAQRCDVERYKDSEASVDSLPKARSKMVTFGKGRLRCPGQKFATLEALAATIYLVRHNLAPVFPEDHDMETKPDMTAALVRPVQINFVALDALLDSTEA